MNLRDTMCTYLAKMWKYIYSFINTDRVGINTTSYRIEYKIIVLRHKDFTIRIDSNFKHTGIKISYKVCCWPEATELGL